MQRHWMMALAVALLAGCTATIPIMHYPTFAEFDELDAIGVQAFTVLPRKDHRNLGAILAGKLAAELKLNGTYSTVYNLGSRSGHPSVQAIITGSVIEFGIDQRTRYELEPVHYTDEFGQQRVDSYQETAHSALEVTLAVMAQLVRSDGEILHATTKPISATIVSEGTPPPMSADACVNRAIDEVIDQLLVEFAVTNATVTVTMDDAMFTAGPKAQGQWPRQTIFTAEDSINVVIVLPPQVDRNEFMLTLRRADNPEVISSHLLTWSRDDSDRGWSASLDSAQLVDHGLGKYRLELSVSGSTPLLWCEFTLIETPPAPVVRVDIEVPEDTEVLPAQPAP
jgi:hypothetical protein